jgi:hypothetical protein
LEPILDVDATLKFLALEKAMSNTDGCWTRASEYNIHQDINGRFHIIPHDANETLRPPVGLGPLPVLDQVDLARGLAPVNLHRASVGAPTGLGREVPRKHSAADVLLEGSNGRSLRMRNSIRSRARRIPTNRSSVSCLQSRLCATAISRI